MKNADLSPADDGILAAREENSARNLAKRFLDQHGEHLAYLRDRWQDEKEYEPWADYEKSMRDRFVGYVILRVVKVGVVLSDGVSEITIKANARSFSVTSRVKG